MLKPTTTGPVEGHGHTPSYLPYPSIRKDSTPEVVSLKWLMMMNIQMKDQVTMNNNLITSSGRGVSALLRHLCGRAAVQHEGGECACSTLSLFLTPRARIIR